jgi:Domain of unknown function (DUF1707)/Cell wall-active antibiotics response 4TMS YvqF
MRKTARVSEAQPPALRVSDAEREAVTTELAQHRAEGRLTLEEFSRRVDLAHAATTGTDLEPLTRDLPAVGTADAARRPTRWLIAFMGGSRRTGRWRIEGKTRVVAVMGGTELDLRAAEITGPEARISCFAFMGGVSIVVPEGVEVEVTGFSLIGGRDVDVKGERRRPGTPLVRIRAFALMGGISVETPRKKLPN